MLGMRKPSSLRASLGTAIHAGTAAFDQAVLDKSPITADEAAGAFIDTLHNPNGDVDYKIDRSITMREAEVIGLTLCTRYCNDIAPKFQFKAVEMKMAPLEVDCGNGIVIRLVGSMDRARVAKVPQIQLISEDNTLYGPTEGTVIPDIKTGGRIIENGQVALKGKSAQLGAYQLMYENTADEITIGSQIIALPTTGKLIPQVSHVWDAKRVMLGTEKSPGLIELAAKMFKDDFFPPNPQSPLCSKKFCPRWETCGYRDDAPLFDVDLPD